MGLFSIFSRRKLHFRLGKDKRGGSISLSRAARKALHREVASRTAHQRNRVMYFLNRSVLLAEAYRAVVAEGGMFNEASLLKYLERLKQRPRKSRRRGENPSRRPKTPT